MRGIYEWRVERPGRSPLVYIGQSIRMEARREEYIKGWGKSEEQDDNNVILRRAVLKYGVGAVSFTPIDLDVAPDELDSRENYWYWRRIEELGRENVANIVEPGKNPLNDPEVRERHAEIMHKWNQDPQWRTNNAEANRKLAQDPEWRAKNAERLRSPEWRERAALAASKDHIFVSPEGETVPIRNLAAFCRENGLSQGNMHGVAHGNRASHKGWTRYADDDERES